jgi:hypothetical protein
MKAKLIFDTTDSDDRQEFLRCTKAFDMSMALWDIIHLRKKLENRFEMITDDTLNVFDGIESFAEGISKILENHNINIDELL